MKKQAKVAGVKLIYSLFVLSMVLQPVSAPGILKAMAADETAVETVAPAVETALSSQEEPKVVTTPVVAEETPAPADAVTAETTAEEPPAENPADDVPADTVAADETVDLTDLTSSPQAQPENGIITPEAASIVVPDAAVAENNSEDTAKKDIWSEDGDKATTNDPVEKDVAYVAPQNEDVTVTFTKLPDNPGTLSIEEIALTDEQVVSLNALSDKAYDITSTMENGTFEYDLTLPKNDSENAGISYIEKSADELDDVEADDVKSIEKVDQKDDSVKASGINHFTIYIVTADLSVVPTINHVSQVTVAPGTTVLATLEVTTLGTYDSDDWKSSAYKIGSGSWICVDTNNHTNDGTYTESFGITAPANPGSYDVSFRVYNYSSCMTYHGYDYDEEKLKDGIIVQEDCGSVTIYNDKISDYSDSKVTIDFSSDRKKITVSAGTGYAIANVWLDVDGDYHAGYYLYAIGPLNNFNPNPGDAINKAKVEVIKVCEAECGDDIKNGDEECDGTDGVPNSNYVCTDKCKLDLVEKKVDICHRTGNNGNPYNSLSANKSADVSGHDGHNGPVWYPGIDEEWGDIIPPFDYLGGSYLGKNWDTTGQAIWNNGCNPLPYCGDGNIDQDEQCDDGNVRDGDGCSATCRIEPAQITACKYDDVNRNGTKDGGENYISWQFKLDDGSFVPTVAGCYTFDNLLVGHTYTITENSAAGWFSSGSSSAQITPTLAYPNPTVEFGNYQKNVCGDGIIDSPSEACELGNTQNCTINNYNGTQSCLNDCSGWDTCQPAEYCGDGTTNGDEQCDDGNEVDGDSCSNSCQINILPVCGDNIKNSDEQCDGTNGVTAGENFCTQSCHLVPIYNGGDSCSGGKVPGDLVYSGQIGSKDTDGETIKLDSGKEYLFSASGTFNPTSASGYLSDAGYTWVNSVLSTQYGIQGTPPDLGAHALLGNFGDGVGIIDWGSASTGHNYDFSYTTSTDPVQFVIGDRYGDWFDTDWQNQSGMGDNSGSLQLDVYECVDPLVITSEAVVNVTETSATITWTTNHPATSRVVYDTVSHSSLGSAPNYGYAYSTIEDPTLTTNHSVVVSPLSSGTTYYFRAVSHGSPEVVGDELSGTTLSSTGTITIFKHTNKSTSNTFIFTPSYKPLFKLKNGGSSASGLLLAGTYTFKEKSDDNWNLNKVICTDTGQHSTYSWKKLTLTVNLAPGSNVTCTFYNKYFNHAHHAGGGGGGGTTTTVTLPGGGAPGGGVPVGPTGGPTGGGVVGPGGEVQGAQAAGPEEVAGAQSQQCSEWPLWVWILLMLGYTGIFNALNFLAYRRIKETHWFGQAVAAAAGFLVWYWFDKCRFHNWFPYTLGIVSIASFWYYLHKLKEFAKKMAAK